MNDTVCAILMTICLCICLASIAVWCFRWIYNGGRISFAGYLTSGSLCSSDPNMDSRNGRKGLRKNMDEVYEIIRTMSKEDKELMGLSEGHPEADKIVKQFIKKVDGVPVAFFQIRYICSRYSIVIGTRSGIEYRNRGYASEVAAEGKRWLDTHFDEFDYVFYVVRKDNTASINIARNVMQLKLDESPSLLDDRWIKFVYIGGQS